MRTDVRSPAGEGETAGARAPPPPPGGLSVLATSGSGRHDSLAGTFDWSLSTLTPEDRRLLGLMATCPGRLPVDLVEALAGDPRTDLDPATALVRPGRDRSGSGRVAAELELLHARTGPSLRRGAAGRDGSAPGRDRLTRLGHGFLRADGRPPRGGRDGREHRLRPLLPVDPPGGLHRGRSTSSTPNDRSSTPSSPGRPGGTARRRGTGSSTWPTTRRAGRRRADLPPGRLRLLPAGPTGPGAGLHERCIRADPDS